MQLFVATGALSAPSPDDVFPSIDLDPVASGTLASSSAVLSRARATVVTLAFQGLGQSQVAAWHAGLVSAGFPPNSQLINIVFLQGWIWRLLRGIVARSTAGALTPQLAASTFTASQPSARDTDHFCDAARIHNRMMAHVFIIDSRGNVRWRAHGAPAEGETDALVHAMFTLAGTPQRGEKIIS